MHSAAWSVIQQLLRQALVATFIFILAKKLSPAEFGLVGIANIWNNFFYLFLELAFAAGLVQRKEITPSHTAAALILNMAFGFAMMVISMGLSGLAADALRAPEARPVIFVMSISFLLTALASVPIAMAQRELAFRALAARDFAANAVAGVTGIAMAMNGFGVWAVVANSLLLNGLLALFLWRITPHRISWRGATKQSIREIWGFGARVFSYTALKYLLRNEDSIAVSVLFGPERLGLYNFAQRITNAPTKSLQLGLATFLFPKGSQLQDDRKSLKELFVSSFTLLNYALLLFSLLLATLGMEMLLKVFGRQWEPAVTVVRILLLYQILAPALVPTAELLKAANRSGWLLNWTLFQTGLAAAALWVGSRFGFEWSVAALVGTWWLTLPLIGIFVAKITGMTWLEFLKRVWKSYVYPTSTAMLIIAAWDLWGSGHKLLAIVCALSAMGVVARAVRTDRVLGLVLKRLTGRRGV